LRLTRAIKTLERRHDRLTQDIASATRPCDEKRRSYMREEFAALEVALEAMEAKLLDDRVARAAQHAATQHVSEASC
jgi:hypothetical protein